MALPPGTRIGSYEIAALIGVGGMGEVYRARDTRLDRDVALKVLPAGVASNADRLARFESEARAVAALNHPNIVTLHSIEDQGLSLTLKGLLLFATGNLDAGMALIHDARRIQERIGDREGGGLALSFLAQMTFTEGDPTGALALYADALASFEAVGDRPEKARVLCETGWTALAAADSSAAMRAFRRAVQAYEEVGSPRGTGLALLGIAACEAADGRAERAVAIAAAAHALSARAGVVVEHPMDPGVVERIEALKASTPTSTLEGIVAEASTLTPAAVLAMVAGQDDSGTEETMFTTAPAPGRVP